MRISTDCGTKFGSDLETSIRPAFTATTLRLSPSTPPLTTSPTAASSATTSPALSPQIDLPSPTHGWFASCIETRSTRVDCIDSVHDVSSVSSVDAPLSGSYPDVGFRQCSTTDVPTRKKARYFSECEYASPAHHSPPAVVSIPPAHESELPAPAKSKKSARRRAASAAQTKVTKRKTPPKSTPVRFCFVSVAANDAENVADGTVELTEQMEQDPDACVFEHGPSELPPRSYLGGISPLQSPLAASKIPASLLEFLPILEARFTRLENAVQRYVEFCSGQALRNSILPESGVLGRA